MLSLGAGSTCDVCLEHFNHEQKAPCSVSCGHVFCLECIHRLTRNTCPLCRAQYDIRSCVKLHVDLESGSPVRASCPTPGEQEARRLQEAITNVANEGSSEPNVRQLIADCRAFLQGHPRTMFPELRVSLRMIAYLYDVKTAYRSQATQLDTLKDQIAQLNLEKAELQRKLEASETGRKDDRELALVVEMNLREHVSRAHAAYETIVDRYNCVVTEWSNLNQELKQLRLRDLQYTRPVMDPSNSGTDSPRPEMIADEYMPSFNLARFKASSVQLTDSHLISPFPDLTERLPPSGTLSDVPELEEEFDVKQERRNSPLRSEVDQCGHADHPMSCQCNRLPRFPDMLPPSNGSRTSLLSRPSFIVEHASPVHRRRGSVSTSAAPEIQNGLSRASPAEYDRGRARSSSNVSPPASIYPGKEEGPISERSLSPSRAVSRSPSPVHEVSTSLPREEPARINVSRSEPVRRLYDILHTPQQQQQVSSSPEPSGGYSSRNQSRRNSSRSRSPPSGRSGSAAMHRHSPLPSSSTNAATIPITSDTHSHAMPTQPPVNVVVSRASDAAMAIEKTQKERQMAEKATKVKEKEEYQRERRKSDRDRDRQEVERVRTDSERSRKSSASATVPAASQNGPTHTTTPTTTASAAPYREQVNSAYVPSAAISSASLASSQKVSSFTSASASATESLTRKSSRTTQREANGAHGQQSSNSHRYASGSSKIVHSAGLSNSSTTPPISV